MWSSLLYVPAFLLVAVHAATLKKASDYFDICHTSDPKLNECIKNTLTKLRGKLIKGIPSLNLLPIEPMKIEKIEMRQGNGDSFQIYQKITDLDVYGLSNYSIDNFSFDYEKKQMNHTLSFPLIKLLGDYEIEGKILILPIKGNGKVSYLCTNVTIDSRVSFETFEKNKEKYIRIKDYKLQIQPQHAEIYFTNLFNGDKRLGDAMNRFLNNNWKEAFESYRELPEQAFADFMKIHMNSVYTRFPENEIFPK
ncbi:protein takeout isoform X2 [Halyomorpha halys]|uniref:protein takeout isoform X2 n=1 Tax=Halyomorpha halys TaxID=286706 RepID=UPI0006D4D4E1|nr:protein takeout-like isoform X2 [Halyomorpha halys]